MKKILLIILSTLIITMLCGCNSMTFQGYTVDTYTDDETEQDYLVVISPHGVSITPRLK